MGVHYHLENSELGLCLECGLLIEGAESGCVALAEEGFEKLRKRALNQELVELFYMGYQLQHFEYFDFNEARAVSFLLTITNYIENKTMKNYANSKKKINSFLRDNFFYLKQILSSVFVMNVVAEEDIEACEELINQYLVDVFNAYFEFHDDFKKLGAI